MKLKLIGLIAAAGILSANYANADVKPGHGNVPFWIGIQDLNQLDGQVATLLADHAVIVALRTPDNAGSGSQLKTLVGRLKQQMPATPILTYAWSNRNPKGKKGSAGLTDWLDAHQELQIRGLGGKAASRFGDVSQPGYQSRTAASIAAIVARGGFDGVILDLSIRTPTYRPAPLAKICQRDAAFCTRYGLGMDATFEAIRKALGGKTLLYNGIWNLGPGSVADQQKLLAHSDAAAIEYFGGDPKQSDNGFSRDILPFFSVMAEVPESKEILVFGRGSLGYTDYAEDYLRQRYLYCAFLLAARENAFFKYHSTFQADVPDGRTGGLDIYADWSNNLGKPLKAYALADGLYSRQFANGLVVVAPDDGKGGSYSLANAMYSPEGEKLSGRISVKPGQGLLLLGQKPGGANSPATIDLKLMADWAGAKLTGSGASEMLALAGGAPAGSHDMLLDAIRSLHPRNGLQVVMQTDDRSASIEAVAEVDDPSHRQQFAIVKLDAQPPSGGRGSSETMAFRSSASRRSGLPVIPASRLTPGAMQTIDLDGRAILARGNLVFRRWDYVRFAGTMKIKQIKLHD